MANRNQMGMRRIQKEYQQIQKDFDGDRTITNLVIRPNPENLYEWFYLIYGLEDCPYEGGFYVGKLLLPVQYPSKPPSILMLTPSGRFEINKKICMSMTDYHPETWSPAWSISKVLIGAVSFMVTDERTTGCVLTNDQKKRELAYKSLLYNMENIPNFKEMFASSFQEIGITDELIKRKKDERDNPRIQATGYAEASGGGGGQGGGNGEGDENGKNSIYVFIGLILVLAAVKIFSN